jgi:N-acetylglucosamine-6-phosphate deacetylase
MKLVIKNGSVVTPLRIINQAGIIAENGTITQILEGDQWTEVDGDQIFDAKGLYIAPGFIDIHNHGGGGSDFMDGPPEAILNASKMHLKYGTTSIVPTTVACPFDDLLLTLDSFKEAKRIMKDGPNLLGMHLEGPYFSMNKKGAHDAQYVKNPDPYEYRKILDYTEDIRIWSIAPELEGALEMATELKKRGIVPSIAHTDANYEEMLRGVEAGFHHVTHLYNAMSSVHKKGIYKHMGVTESVFLFDDLTVEVIADGIHLPAPFLKLIYKLKGPDQICLVTDALKATGMPEGEYIIGNAISGFKIIVEDGIGKLPDRSAIAGSLATADRLVRTMMELADVPLCQAVRMMTLTPAKVLGIDDRKGSLVSGKDADIVVFDQNINIRAVFVGGEILVDHGIGKLVS